MPVEPSRFRLRLSPATFVQQLGDTINEVGSR